MNSRVVMIASFLFLLPCRFGSKLSRAVLVLNSTVDAAASRRVIPPEYCARADRHASRAGNASISHSAAPQRGRRGASARDGVRPLVGRGAGFRANRRRRLRPLREDAAYATGLDRIASYTAGPACWHQFFPCRHIYVKTYMCQFALP